MKEVKIIDKNGEETTKSISYKLQFIDSEWIMASSLANLVDNLTELIQKKVNVNTNMIIKYVKYAELNTNTANDILNIQTFKMI